MSKGLRLIFRAATGQFEETYREMLTPLRKGAMGAVNDAAAEMKQAGRADIAAAGFGTKWQNALRVDVYPKGKDALTPSIRMKHNISYAGVFERGAVINGSMWLTMPTIDRIVGRSRMTPTRFINEVGRGSLHVFQSGGRKFLSARVKGTNPRGKFSINDFRMGRRGGKGPFISVPVFVGVDSVNIRKRFSLRNIFEKSANSLPELYVKHLQKNG